MHRRLVAGSIVVALVAPWVIVLATAVHLALDHDHDGDDHHDVASRVASAWHGHAHESGTVPHEHSVTAAQRPVMQPPAGLGMPVVVPAVTVSADSQPSLWIGTAKLTPPQPPTASPPILRV